MDTAIFISPAPPRVRAEHDQHHLGIPQKSRLFSPLPTENPLGEGLQQQISLSKILCTLKTEATALGNAGTDEHLCRHIWKSSKGKHSMSG